MSLIDPRLPTISGDEARALLRRLRDSNVSTGPIVVRRGFSARLGGCTSLDAPAESGVRYRVRTSDAAERTLELAWTGGGLDLALTHPMLSAAHLGVHATGESGVASAAIARLRAAVTCDQHGRACIRALGARIRPGSADERQLEHFLRRAVRTLFA